MQNNSITWTQKYLPKTAVEVEGQAKAVLQVRNFMTDYKRQKKKAALLHGPSGCGKSAAAYALANELDLEVLELNASDLRNADAIQTVMGAASKQRSLFAKGKLLLVDEIDGIAGREDRGGASAIVSLIKESAFPILITANDPFDKKFSAIRKASLMVEFNVLDHNNIFNVLARIAKAEGIGFDDIVLKGLARRAGGDCRAAINDFQITTAGKKELKKDDLEMLSTREQKETMIDAMLKIFKSSDPSIAITAFNNVVEDLDKCTLWIDENLPHEYKNPDELARAYHYISQADIMSRRIRRWQHWRFMVYINAFLTAGVAVSKNEKNKDFVQYKPTTRILKLWQANMKYQKRKAIAEKVAAKTHCSTKDAIQSTVPYLQIIFQKNKKQAAIIADDLDLDDGEVEWLSK